MRGERSQSVRSSPHVYAVANRGSGPVTENCPNFGAKLDADARYCSQCGEAIGERVEPEPQTVH